MKKILCLLLIAVAVLTVGCKTDSSSSEKGETVAISIVSVMPEGHFYNKNLLKFKELVEEKSEGSLEINFLGGPEVMDVFEVADAVRTGMVDIAYTVPAFHAAQIPEVLALNYTNMTLAETFESGGFDYLSQLHRDKLGAVMFAQEHFSYSTLYTINEVKSVEDFKGMVIRGLPNFLPAIVALEATMELIPTSEVYTALERGMVDGIVSVNIGLVDLSLHDVLGYKIRPYFYGGPWLFLFNEGKFNQLSENQQEAIREAIEESGLWFNQLALEQEEIENQILTESGVQIIELEDGEYFFELVHEKAWEMMSESVEDIENLKELFWK